MFPSPPARAISFPLVRSTTLGQSVYPDIALHISYYYINISHLSSLDNYLFIQELFLIAQRNETHRKYATRTKLNKNRYNAVSIDIKTILPSCIRIESWYQNGTAICIRQWKPTTWCLYQLLFLLYWFIKCDDCYDNMVWDMTLYPDLSVCRRVDILFMLFVFVSVVVPHMSWLCEHRGECLIRDRNCFLVTTTWVHPGFLVRSMFLALFVLVPCLVYPVLSVSVDYPFLIATSVFSGVYLQKEAISPP